MNKTMLKTLMSGYFGLEKESLRVMADTGRLAVTAHPFEGDPNISKDFCESQVEIITPVTDSVDALYGELQSLNRKVLDKLALQGETLFNYSNPPAIYSEDEINVARFENEDHIKEDYRYYLKDKYGLWVMLLSGIHYNFSFASGALEILKDMHDEDKDSLYLKLGAYSFKYAWLVTYLTAASPCSDPTYGGKKVEAASLRCSSAGYWNDFIPVLDYSSLDRYIESIEKLVKDGLLCTPWELYLPVRLKPKGANDLENLRGGIDHIELRMIDLNPLYDSGVCLSDLEFIHLLLVYLAGCAPFSFNKEEQEMAVRNMQASALLSDGISIEMSPGRSMGIKEAGLLFLNGMEAFFGPLECKRVNDAIAFQKAKLTDDKNRYVSRIFAELSC